MYWKEWLTSFWWRLINCYLPRRQNTVLLKDQTEIYVLVNMWLNDIPPSIKAETTICWTATVGQGGKNAPSQNSGWLWYSVPPISVQVSTSIIIPQQKVKILSISDDCQKIPRNLGYTFKTLLAPNGRGFVSVWAHIRVHMHVDVRSYHGVSFLDYSSSLLFETVLSLNLKLSNSARTNRQWTLGVSLCPPPPSPGVTRVSYHTQTERQFTNWVIPSAPSSANWPPKLKGPHGRRRRLLQAVLWSTAYHGTGTYVCTLDK